MFKISTFTALFLFALLTACSDNTPQQMPPLTVVNVSSNATIQATYAGCIRDMTHGLINDNPGTEQNIMKMMLQPVPEMCHGYVVKPCEKDISGFLCKTMIDEYKDK